MLGGGGGGTPIENVGGAHPKNFLRALQKVPESYVMGVAQMDFYTYKVLILKHEQDNN